MTATLRAAFAELAGQAGSYLHPDAAIAADRRRRRRRAVLVPLAAAAVVGAVLLAGALWPAGARVVSPPGAAGYPAAVTPPDAGPSLPTDRAVGVAAFVYSVWARPCTTECPAYLVLPDGRQFRLDPPPRQGSTARVTLSPDGRWLGQAHADGYVVRDLTGTTTYRLPADLDPSRWSPDSRWLLLARHSGTEVAEYVRLDLDSGAQQRYKPPEPQLWAAAGVLPSGEILVVRTGVAAGSRGDQLVLAAIDPVTGEWRDQRTVSLAGPSLRPDENAYGAGMPQVYLSPGGQGALVTVLSSTPTMPPTPRAVLGVDLTDGHVWGRFDDLGPYDQSRGWEVRGEVVTHGILFATWRPGAVELVAVHPVTGERRVVTRLPAETQVVLRGSSHY